MWLLLLLLLLPCTPAPAQAQDSCYQQHSHGRRYSHCYGCSLLQRLQLRLLRYHQHAPVMQSSMCSICTILQAHLSAAAAAVPKRRMRCSGSRANLEAANTKTRSCAGQFACRTGVCASVMSLNSTQGQVHHCSVNAHVLALAVESSMAGLPCSCIFTFA